MQIRQAPHLLGEAWYEKAGGIAMGVVRSGVGLFTKSRGDRADTLVQGAAPVNYANLAVYGTLATLALALVVKGKK